MLVQFTTNDDTAFQEMCRKNGWRRTIQRRAVFNCLCGNRDHPSVETVWQTVRENLPDVSLDSIYRILDDFAEAGVIRRLESGRVIRYDSDTGSHGHFVCTVCGRLLDFDHPGLRQLADACRGVGDIDTIELNVRGRCHRCSV